MKTLKSPLISQDRNVASRSRDLDVLHAGGIGRSLHRTSATLMKHSRVSSFRRFLLLHAGSQEHAHTRLCSFSHSTACGTQDVRVESPQVLMVCCECQVMKGVRRVIIACPPVLFALVSTSDKLFT